MKVIKTYKAKQKSFFSKKLKLNFHCIWHISQVKGQKSSGCKKNRTKLCVWALKSLKKLHTCILLKSISNTTLKIGCMSLLFLPFFHWSLEHATHRGAFCQFPFRWIYYYDGNKSTGKETGKTHLCAVSWKGHKFSSFGLKLAQSFFNAAFLLSRTWKTSNSHVEKLFSQEI